jgi:hypothetical protein
VILAEKINRIWKLTVGGIVNCAKQGTDDGGGLRISSPLFVIHRVLVRTGLRGWPILIPMFLFSVNS